MKNAFFIGIIWLILTSEDTFEKSAKLIWKGNIYSRSSFCLYNDNLFYQTTAAGCTHQWFAWGKWTKKNDTLFCEYSAENIFNYQVKYSKDTSTKFHIVRLIDRYNQPIRFQFINHNKGFSNTYNIGLLKLEKHNEINYPAPFFDESDFKLDYFETNADTITIQWNCNREVLESISGGSLITNSKSSKQKFIITGNRAEEIFN